MTKEKFQPNPHKTKGDIAKSIFNMLKSYTTNQIKLDEERGIILMRTQHAKRPDHTFRISVTEMGDMEIA